MKSSGKIFLGVWLASSLYVSNSALGAAAESVPAVLRQLAARAGEPGAQARLRRWAAAASPEDRGLAYFVVGYREYAAGDYLGAVVDLRQAAATPFSLSDFAEYYGASAAAETAQHARVVEALDGFSARHPHSTLRFDALALLAKALLQTDQAERAIQVLVAERRVRQQSSLAGLLAQAYRQAQKPIEAARAYQEVYYVYATSPEAKTAEDALNELLAQLGSGFPVPTEGLQTARPDAFFNRSRFAEAQKEYGFLLQANPSSGFAGRWRVKQARCFLRLKRTRDALELLIVSAAGNPTVDGERLAALVEAYSQQTDAASMVSALEQLQTLYPQSQSYASALSSAGAFFVRQGDWGSALKYYEPLAQQFPETESGREGHWRVAWGYHLQRQDDQARRYLLEHVSRYPTSAHVPAALYWLGRLEEERGARPTARALYEFLTKRYLRTYYALQAGARLKEGAGQQTSAPQSVAAAPDPAVMDLIQKIPVAAPPPVQPCAPVPASESLGPFETLRALSLSDLAGEYLKDVLAEQPDTPELRLAASRAEAEAGHTSVALLNARKLAPNAPEYEFSTLPKEVWGLLYPRPFLEIVRRQARANRLDPYLVMGLIRQESAFNPGAISSANARGLMQLLPKTAARQARQKRGVGRRIYDPAVNIRLGSAYLASLLKMFGGSEEQALAAYNAGDSRVKEWLSQRQFSEPAEFAETIPFRETRVYVQTVLRDADIYRQLLEGVAGFASCEVGGPSRAGVNHSNISH
jgi:soluble lytic murein transglycosylase